MIKQILEQHAAEAAVLWIPRDVAARAPNYTLADLEEVDERLEAHLDGLRLGGDDAWAIAKKALASPLPGRVFVAGVLAAEQVSAERLAVVLDAATEPPLARALASALGWVPIDRCGPLLTALLAPDRPAAHRRVGIAAHAAHRVDPGAALGNALFDDDEPRIKARALRAAGELGRADLLPQITAALGSTDAEWRFHAAWSAALLGVDAAAPVLWAFAEAGGSHAEVACAAALRRMDPKAALRSLKSLALSPDHERAAIAGAAALGDSWAIPFLIERMGKAETARFAGEAFTAITGARIERSLAGGPPEGHVIDAARDLDPKVNPDASLPWPDPRAVSEWWTREAARFPTGARHLCGAQINDEHLARVLAEGDQRRRAVAAIEIASRAPGKPLFEVRAPAARQRRAITR